MNTMAENNTNASSDQFFLYIGAYTDSDEEGIYVYRFDATNGEFKFLSTAKGVKNPSYLAINPKNNLLIAVNELGEFNGEKSGAVSSFAINSNGSLRPLNMVASGGQAPCYVSIDKAAKWALVANYNGGNVSIFPIEKDGMLKPYTDFKQHFGVEDLNGKKSIPHAHSIVYNPKEEFVLAVDLGIDKVMTYKVDKKKGALTNIKSMEFNAAKGAGPRHLTFHPNKKLVFFISELNSTITSCTYNTKTGKMKEVMTLSTLPDSFSGDSYCADIHVSPNGDYLYGSNRGHDSIVIFKIDQKTGELTFIDHHSVDGKWPRNFMIDPTGKFLLVANQHSNNVVVFKIDAESGKLKANGVELKISKPVCLKMMEIKQ